MNIKFYKIKPFFTLLLFCSYSLFAQDVAIFGSVIDAKTLEPLIGVNVVVEGTTNGTVTDLDGKFSLQIAPGSWSITASYLGYLTNTRSNIIIQSKGNDDVNFEMVEGGLDLVEVVVKANPFQPSLITPLSLQRLSPEEIKTYPGGNNDIAKVVQSLPGVSGSIGGFRNDVIIRGGAPNENVYYLDGIEIPNINHFSTQGSAGGPVGLLNVDFIEGVELSASAFGARYDNPLSGVLQFDQRIGNQRQRQTNIRVSASETAFTTEGPLLKKGKEESKTSYLISVRRSYLQFLFALIGLPIRPDYWDYQYKINHILDDRNTIFLTGLGSIDNYSVKAPDDFDIEQISTLEQVPIIEQTTTTAGLGWKHRLKENKGVMNTYLSFNVLNNDFTRYKDNESLSGLLFQNISREEEQKLRFEYTRFIKGWTVTGGANVTNANYLNETAIINQNLTFDKDINFLRYGFFTQATNSFLSGRLNVSAGVRVDDNTFSNESATLLKTLSTRFSFSYALDEDKQLRLNASVGKYYKIASYTILGYQNTLGIFTNKDVPYIGSLHGVLGLDYQIGEFGKVSAEGFYKRYTDYPISVLDGVSLANKGGDFSVLGNEEILSDGEGRSYGVELLYQQKLNKNLYGIFAYTYFKSEFTDINGDYLPSVWDSRHLVSVTGGYKFGKSWEVSFRYRFAGSSPYAPVDETASLATYPILVLDYSQLSNSRLDPFSQLDLRLDKKWNFKFLALNVFLDVQNALSQQIPSPPQLGLARDEQQQIITPNELTEIAAGSSAPLPSIGIAIDF